MNPERFSKWSRLQRATVWVLRFLKKLTKERFTWLKSLSSDGHLTANDCKIAEWVLIKQAQSEGISDREKTKWQLYCTENGVWKSMSRLENSELDEGSKHP
ncbi:unnamed protein product, partial [Gongylonema pulchrum]|uniref:DNA replication protein n=1 Tax=Gongylonema pulchrum TaxID=637853 RepID=A0A183F1R2_9BILA